MPGRGVHIASPRGHMGHDPQKRNTTWTNWHSCRLGLTSGARSIGGASTSAIPRPAACWRQPPWLVQPGRSLVPRARRKAHRAVFCGRRLVRHSSQAKRRYQSGLIVYRVHTMKSHRRRSGGGRTRTRMRKSGILSRRRGKTWQVLLPSVATQHPHALHNAGARS